MQFFNRLFFLLAKLLLTPTLRYLVSPRIAPADVTKGLNLDPNKPVVYILPTSSWADRLLVDKLCAEKQLPRIINTDKRLPGAGEAVALYLPALDATRRESKRARVKSNRGLAALLGEAMQEQNSDMQLVPVSILWGRDPGKETSLFKLIFSDTREPGRIRKFFIVLAQGSQCFVNFGLPVSFRDFAQHESNSGDLTRATRKLVRVFRIHFARQRSAALGPTLYTRSQMLKDVVKYPMVRNAIARRAKEEGQTEESARAEAHKYADEIAANYSNNTVRVLDLLLRWVWRKIFSGVKVFHSDRVRAVAPHYGVIYMPSHRSHLDYLLISQMLYDQSLMPPHIAAGINLNFWPVGGILRRGGAFYLRRSFGGNKLYTAVFRTYVEILMRRGHSLEFFPEGGRSRTGRLLTPKTGMLAMALHSYVRHPDKPLMVVPVYVGYDKVPEGGTYVKELRGASKKKESAGQLLQARRIFKSSYGSPYISFGDPIVIDEFLDQQAPDWREHAGQEERPEWLPHVVDALADENMRRINAAAVVNPVSLVSLALLASPEKALAEHDLIHQVESFAELLKRVPYSGDVVVPVADGKQALDEAAHVSGLLRIDHPWGEVITVQGKEATLLTYYRNTVQHLLALPSLLARFLRHTDAIEERELINRCMGWYPFLQRELFLRQTNIEAHEQLPKLIDALVDMGLLQREGTLLRRPDVRSAQYATLIGLSRVMRETLERYCMISLLLSEHVGESIARKDFEAECTLMAERMGILSGRMAPEYFDKGLFKNFIDTLLSEGLAVCERDGPVNKLRVTEKVCSLSSEAVELLGPTVQQTVLQLISRPKLESKTPADATPPESPASADKSVVISSEDE